MSEDFDMFAEDDGLKIYQPPGAFPAADEWQPSQQYLRLRDMRIAHSRLLSRQLGLHDPDEEEDREWTADDLLDESDD